MSDAGRQQRVEPTHGALASNASCSERRVGRASERNTIVVSLKLSRQHPLYARRHGGGLAAESRWEGAAMAHGVPDFSLVLSLFCCRVIGKHKTKKGFAASLTRENEMQP